MSTQLNEKQKRHIHTMEYYSALKRNVILIYTTWISLKDNMLSEVS